MTSKEIIHFAHANGFPAQTYTKLFSFLQDDFEINYLERHAHNPKFPVTDNWERLRDELLENLENRYSETAQKVVGVGHSLGGILHFLAAVENPELYRAIILLDAPLVSRLSGAGLKFLKRSKLIDKFSPSQTTRFRRSIWRNRREALAHFQQKEKFQAFDAEVLKDYVEHGMIEKGENVRLLFDPATEAKIYRTIPHGFTKFRGKLKVPAFYIGGTNSREARLARLGFMRKNFSFKFSFVPGTHLFPFENPSDAARAIRAAIADLPK